ncbi:hypothetical protein CLOP_g10436 [Closterium sp. NIES-67]|nr:hypothetical protein CLOP_g10436 [Closterium sp. NIES-67]
MGKKGKGKPGKGKEKTERKTAKAEAKKQRREEKQVDEEDDVDAILAKIAAEEAKKKEVHVDEGMVVNPLKDTELVIFGGEFYNGDKTHVYGDLYRFNADKATWRLVSSPNSPPPRSGHHAVAWKNFVFVFGGEFTSPNQERFHHFKVLYKQRILLFGGFYDNLRDVRYFNDLHVLDLTDMKWAEVKPKPGAAWPSPRSAFQFAAHQDEVFLYGGYFKDHAKDADGRDRGVVKRLGSPPSARAGFSLAVHRSRAILVGGVVDTEEKGGDVLRSIFLDDMFAFQMDARRWFPLLLRSQQQAKAAGRKAELTAGGEVTRGAKSTALADGEDEEESDEETEGRKSMQPGNEADSEEEEEEEGSESTWVEEEEEEDDESGEEGSGGEDDEDEDEDENESSDDDASAKGTGSAPTASELAAAVLRGEGPAGGKRQLSRKERRAEIDRIRADLGLADTERTPAPGESLRDFFARTGDHWQREAYQHTQRTGKELRKDGFDLCEARYRDLLPVLTELEKLEAEQKAEEEAEAAVNKGKGKKDKGRPASRR